MNPVEYGSFVDRRIERLRSAGSLFCETVIRTVLLVASLMAIMAIFFEEGDALMERNFTARGHHDMGGLPADEIDREEHDYALWEKRVDALMMLCTNRLKLMTVDQLRKGIEALPPSAYEDMTYYERWISSVANTLLERGVFTAEELGAKMEEVRQRYPDGVMPEGSAGGGC